MLWQREGDPDTYGVSDASGTETGSRMRTLPGYYWETTGKSRYDHATWFAYSAEHDILLQGQGPRSGQGQTLSAGEHPAYTALASMKTPFGQRLARLTVVYFQDKAYIFVGARKDGSDNRKYRTEFLNASLSLRALSQEQRALAQGRRIVLLRANAGTRYSALAARSELSSYAEDQLRLINGDYPRGEPVPGRLIKSVQ